MNKQIYTSISLTINPSGLPVFYPMLQQGFMIKAQVECSVKHILCTQFNVSPEYMKERIKTIFLNSRPVDDPESAIVKDGAVLALSAAMPGLVGATFRSGGVLAAFRSSISHLNEETGETSSHDGMITLKLFNLLTEEMGQTFLERGIWVKKEILEELIKRKKADLFPVLKSVQKNGQEISPDHFSGLIWSDEPALIFIKVMLPV